MDTHWFLLAIAVALIGFAVWLDYRKKRSERLQDRFDPECERTVRDSENRTKTESEPRGSERGVERLDIVPLTTPEAARSIRSWYGLQGRFINNPQNVVAQADRLARELMLKRGYPMAEFERRAAHISVEHPGVVHNYRAGQAIAVRAERGQASIEDLRRAIEYYRVLFEDLLEVIEVSPEILTDSRISLHS